MIAITMGDANGVGPEIILKSHCADEITGEYVVIGDYSALRMVYTKLGCNFEMRCINKLTGYRPKALNIIDLKRLKYRDMTPGKISEKVAAASREYIVRATEMTQSGVFDAVVTLPVNKEAIRLSDPEFTGHTELIAGLCGQENYTMMLVSKRLTVTHVSTHVSMAQAMELVKQERILNVIKLTYDALCRFIEQPRIAVAGLNAHAGEGGAFGRQEIDEIAPAIRSAKSTGIYAVGPISPDTVFQRCACGEFDAVVCMYHDQGHIPLKLLDFEGGVNVTLGLSVMRTSVDHGTAYDIAWQGKAHTGSFVSAFEYAKKIAKHA